MRRSQTITAIAAAVALVAGCSSSETFETLPSIGTSAEKVTVSGLSAGAYMAGQYHIAHSDSVVGAGLVAGGPYGCGRSQFTKNMSGPGVSFINLGKAVNGCMKNNLKLAGVPNVPRLAEVARDLSHNDAIDPLQNLKAHKIYLYSASADQTVVGEIVSAARDFYEDIGVPHGNITFLREQSGAHAFITSEGGLACGTSGSPYINDCDYDQAQEILAHLRGSMKPRSSADPERFVTFDQAPFTNGIENHSMAESGIVYIPEQCSTGTSCAVHIVFHGCGQGDSESLANVARTTGYAELAQSNDLVVLFPRAAVSAANPAACWDWWGYTGPEYLTKNAPQIRAVRAMQQHLSGQS